MSTITVNTAQFPTVISDSQKPVLVDFWAPWCGYCRRIAPALEQVAQQWADKLVVAKVNVDEEPALAQQENIEVLPTLVLFRAGTPVASTVAPTSKASIEEFLREHLGS